MKRFVSIGALLILSAWSFTAQAQIMGIDQPGWSSHPGSFSPTVSPMTYPSSITFGSLTLTCQAAMSTPAEWDNYATGSNVPPSYSFDHQDVYTSSAGSLGWVLTGPAGASFTIKWIVWIRETGNDPLDDCDTWILSYPQGISQDETTNVPYATAQGTIPETGKVLLTHPLASPSPANDVNGVQCHYTCPDEPGHYFVYHKAWAKSRAFFVGKPDAIAEVDSYHDFTLNDSP